MSKFGRSDEPYEALKVCTVGAGGSGSNITTPTDHGALTGLLDDDHTQYVHISVARTITAVHTFNPVVGSAPWTLGANAQGQTVVGLKADQLNKSVTAGDGLTGGGALTGDVSLAVDSTVVRTSRQVIAGNGLTDGGALSSDVTLNVGSGNGISVAADAVAVDQAYAFNWSTAHTFQQGATFNGNLVMADDADITLGTEVQILDHGSHGHIIINTGGTVDEQFDLDVGGNLRAQGWIVGRHAIQIANAVMICHYDGQKPFNTDFTGDPTGHMGQIATVAGGVIYRPGKFGKAIQVAEATTNLVPNPSFEVDTTGWAGSNCAIEISTAQAKYGTHALKMTASGASPSEAYFTTTVSAGWHTLTAHVRRDDDGVVDATNCKAYVQSVLDWDSITPEEDGWYRCVVTASLSAGVAYADVYLVGQSAGAIWYVDAVQLEAKAYRTGYCDGSLGTGHSWSGSAHASTSSRTAASVYYSLTRPAKFTLMAWLYRDAALAHDYGYMFAHIDDHWSVYYNTSYHDIIAGVDAGVPTDGWHHYAITFDGVTTRAYRDGAYIGKHTTAISASSLFTVGTFVNLGYQANSRICDYAIIGRSLTNSTGDDSSELLALVQSDAPIFAETSTWQWRAGNNLAWADSEGLWVVGASGNAAFGVSGIASKSWGGTTLDAGDVLIGRVGASANSLMWDASAGTLSLRNNATVTGLWDAAGGITLGEVAASKSNIYISAGKLQIRNNLDVLGLWDSDGTIVIGEASDEIASGRIIISAGVLNITNTFGINRLTMTDAGVLTINDSAGDPVFTFNGSGGAEFSLPLTMGSSGGIYQGSGTFASPTTGLKIWNDSGVGRIATYNSTVLQVGFDSSGQLIAGGGSHVFNSNGQKIYVNTSADVSRGVRFEYDSSGDKQIGVLYGSYGLAEGSSYVRLAATHTSGDPWSKASLTLQAYDYTDPTHKQSFIALVSDPPTCDIIGDVTISDYGDSNGSLKVVGAFGANNTTPQTPYASGGAAPAGGTGATAGAYDTAAHRDTLITLVNNIRAALVANGIMS